MPSYSWLDVSNADILLQFRQPNEAIAEYSEDEDEIGSPVAESSEFILGFTPTNFSVQQLHPSTPHIFLLWQIFLDNVNPMTKLIHQPTFQETLVHASSNLDNLPRGLEAMMFAIYSAAVFSIADDECEMKLGESRKVLLARYRHATRKALARARFMATSELVVLQAFTIYLLTMREVYDSRTTWILAGVASRVAQGMGIHRDGTNIGVSPFETEMRRRLWWQITIMDFRSAELSGSSTFGEFNWSDTQRPSNVNDADIHPDMPEAPVSQTKPTEMIACLLRCEFGAFWKEKVKQKSNVAFENMRTASPWTCTTLEERDAHINELEQRIEEKFLRYCDPSIPIQFITTIIGRAAMSGMRLMVHHPRKYANPEDVPASERAYLWKLSIKLLESDNLAHSTKGLQRFLWHTNVYFQWQALIYLLNELKEHTLGEQVDHAWQEVDDVFRHHSSFVTEYRKPLHVAVGSLCLKAYNAREKALRETTNGILPNTTPEYIKLFREQRKTGPLRGASAKEEDIDRANAAIKQLTVSTWRGNPTNQPGDVPQAPDQAAIAQLPLPAFQPVSMPNQPDENLLFASDPSLAHDLAMADMPMEWAQWDYLMEDFTQMR